MRLQKVTSVYTLPHTSGMIRVSRSCDALQNTDASRLVPRTHTIDKYSAPVGGAIISVSEPVASDFGARRLRTENVLQPNGE